MKSYFAAYEGSAEVYNKALIDVLDNRLVSYHVMGSGRYDTYILGKYYDSYSSLIIDSGAFSAWGQGIEIYHKDYVKDCLDLRYRDKYDFFVVLDRIPNAGEQPDDCARISMHHYEYMLEEFAKAGVPTKKIIPVYHQGEDISFLEDLLTMGADYIGLSPSNASTNKTPQKRDFLNSCWDICMKDGKPKAKFHAFGLSNMALLREFKDLLYSADAKTWADNASKGQILVPDKVSNSENFYDKWSFIQPDLIDIGNQAGRDTWWLKKDGEGDYKIPDERRREIVEYIRDLGLHIGYSIISRKPNTTELGEWENELGNSADRELKRYGYKRGQSSYAWTEDLDLRKWGFETEDNEPFIRYGLTHDITLRMWMNVFATREWALTVVPTYAVEPEMTPEDKDTQQHVFDMARARYLKRKARLASGSEIPEGVR